VPPPNPELIITPVVQLPPIVVAAVESAMATAPPEILPWFTNPAFLRDAMRYFRVPGIPPE
jgi:hypothetical protein